MRFEQRGFTLVEMMIALVVLSLVSLGTVTALRTMGMTHERLSATTERVDEIRQVSQFLRDSLRQVMAAPQSGFDGAWVMPVAGLPIAEREELVWLAPFQAAGGSGGLNYFRLYRVDNTLRLQLQAHHAAFDHSSWPGLGDGELLVTGLEEFYIEYRLDMSQSWQDRPTPEELLTRFPAMLRIVIKADGRYWPEIVVAPSQAGGM